MTDPTAVVGRRIGAFFIDLATALIVFTLIFFPLATKRTVDETLDLPGCKLELDDSGDRVTCENRQILQIGDTVYEAGGASFLFDFAFVFLYFGIVAGITGATLGKLLVGIRVVREDGSNAGVGKSLLRFICWFVDIFLVGIILIFTSRGHRRLGDMAAGTYVVNKEAVGRPIVLPAVPGAAGVPAGYGAYPGYGVPPAAGPQPQWDATRGTYIQWDPATGRYLTWDEPTRTWR
jgi:uncharacterized RDD family membrane protein YckC